MMKGGKANLRSLYNWVVANYLTLTAVQTFTNKTLTTPIIASLYQDAAKTKLMTVPDTVSDTLAAIAATQTLTNKTLTTPIIATLYQDAGKTLTVTMPAATDTLVGKATTDTLTNKTIDSAGTGNLLKNVVLNYTGSVTLNEIKAGKTLIAAVAGKTIKVLRYFVQSTGEFTTGTSVILQDTNNPAVIITTIAVAALTDGAKISSEVTAANVTDGVGLRASLTAAKGIAIPADAAMAGGTSILVSIDYMYV